MPRDLPRWLSFALPIGSYAAVAIAGLVDPALFHRILAKDDAGGWVEHATVLVLLPAIAAGVALVAAHRARLRARFAVLWVVAITTACVYFAGEEMSWGQWLFGWQTPELFERINDQRETNLHNTSYWLNHGPITVVHAWIAFGSLALPLVRRARRSPPRDPHGLGWIVWPTAASIPAAATLALATVPAWLLVQAGFPQMFRLGRSEMLEFLTALFFGFYLVSLWWRVRRLPAAEADRGGVPPRRTRTM